MLTLLLGQINTADLPPVAPGKGTFWKPMDASTFAPAVDTTFYFIYWVSVFFFVLITVLLVYFVIRYRRRAEGEPTSGAATHNTALEITWSAIPLVLVVVMFYLGFKGYIDVLTPPANALDVYVTGQKWSWSFTYPNGVTDTELHVPVGTPVRLILQSSDVIHSFYVPAFRIKRDAVPGRYNKIWFEATQPGEYLALCAEYCGTSHSDMLTRVVVHPPGMFEKWMTEAMDVTKGGTVAPAVVGRQLVARRCASCHSVDGKANVGPTFQGLWNREIPLKTGPPLVADENYIRESILYPMAKIHAGYDPVMPTFKGQLKDNEITAIIEYIKEISGVAPAATWTELQPGEPKPPQGTTP